MQEARGTGRVAEDAGEMRGHRVPHRGPVRGRQPAADPESVAVEQQETVLGPFQPGEDGRAAVGRAAGERGRGRFRGRGAAGAHPGVRRDCRRGERLAHPRHRRRHALGAGIGARGPTSRCSSACGRSPAT